MIFDIILTAVGIVVLGSTIMEIVITIKEEINN